MEFTTRDDDIILDFFSGSGTTAQAVFSQNLTDRYSRRFILVQLPEALPSGSIARKNGYNDLCQLAESRLQRAGNATLAELSKTQSNLNEEKPQNSLPDIGFRVFTLDSSGIDKPQPGQLMLDIVKPDRSDMDIVFEMMLKWGLELTLPVEQEGAAGYPIHSVAYGELVCCLAPGLTIDALDAIAAMEPRRVLMRDSILTDTLKLNAIQVFKRVEERTGREVELRTV